MGDTAASGRVATEEPRRTSRRGIAQTYGRWEKKNESKGGGKWNAGVVIGAGEACDGIVALLVIDSGSRWCSWRYTGAAVEVSKMSVSASCCTLVSCRQQKIHRDVSHVSKPRLNSETFNSNNA